MGGRADAAAARRGANVFPNFLGYLKDSGDESFKRRGYFLKVPARRRPPARWPGARHAPAGGGAVCCGVLARGVVTSMRAVCGAGRRMLNLEGTRLGARELDRLGLRAR
jgi:hypothetical protein